MRQILSVVVGVVLVIAIGGAQRLIPDADRIYRPIAAKGALKEAVRALPYTVRVDTVALARTLTVKKSYGEPEKKTTQGLWVALTVTATASKEQVSLGKVALRAKDGTMYGVADRVRGLDTADLEAGMPQSGPLAFELPPAAAEGAVLLLSEARYAGIHRLNGALGPAIEIDLGITGAQIAAPAQDLTVTEVEW